MSLARSTPFKRMRSPTGRLSYDPMCTPTFDGFDDAALDNVRSQKRYLSEVSHKVLFGIIFRYLFQTAFQACALLVEC